MNFQIFQKTSPSYFSSDVVVMLDEMNNLSTDLIKIAGMDIDTVFSGGFSYKFNKAKELTEVAINFLNKIKALFEKPSQTFQTKQNKTNKISLI